jgi:hypothetical protein
VFRTQSTTLKLRVTTLEKELRVAHAEVEEKAKEFTTASILSQIRASRALQKRRDCRVAG